MCDALVFSQHFHDRPEPVGIIADPVSSQQLTGIVDNGDIMVILGPVDTAHNCCHVVHMFPSPFTVCSSLAGPEPVQDTRAP